MWEVLVEEWPNAAPVAGLLGALRYQEYEVFRTRDAGARAVVAGLGRPLLRVTPHRNEDGCGYHCTHAAYSVAWSLPMFCQFTEVVSVQATLRRVEQLRRACAH
jgi:hypothetical protein